MLEREKMSFTSNHLNNLSKSVATVTPVTSANPPLELNLNTRDTVKNTGDKSNLTIESNTTESKSDDNISLFVFGSQSQSKTDIKTSEGFNFVLDSNSFNSAFSIAKAKARVSRSKSFNFTNKKNSMFDHQGVEPKLDDKAKSELDSDNSNNSNEMQKCNEKNSNDSSVTGQELNDEEPRQNEDCSSEEMVIVKTLVREFKDVIENFVKERIEGEKKIVAIQSRVSKLERELQNLKNADPKNSSTACVTNSHNTVMSTTFSQQPPTMVSHGASSPTELALAESSSLKTNVFGLTSSLFGASNPPIFNGTPPNSYGFPARSMFDVPTTTAAISVLGSFTPNTSTQTQAGGQLFGSTIQTSNQIEKNLEPEAKKRGSHLLFSQEAVPKFFNALKEPDAKVNSRNSLRKMTNGQEIQDQNQNIPTKEAFLSHLQKTLEITIEKSFEEFWAKSKCNNTSEDILKKFNSGNIF